MTNLPLYFILRGIFLNRFTLLVTSSPIIPFPLVTPLISSPFLYVRTIVSPSNFHDNNPSLSPIKLTKSSIFLVFDKDNIGFGCSTFCKFSDISVSTCILGLSSNTILVLFSNSISSSYNLSYS